MGYIREVNSSELYGCLPCVLKFEVLSSDIEKHIIINTLNIGNKHLKDMCIL